MSAGSTNRDETPRKSESLLVPSQLMRQRNAAEARFKAYGATAIIISMATLFFTLWTIFSDGVSAFVQSTLEFPVTLSSEKLDPLGDQSEASLTKPTTIAYKKVLDQALIDYIVQRGISTEGVSDKDIAAFISGDAAARLRQMVIADPNLLDQTISFAAFATGRIDGYFKGRVTMETAKLDSNISPAQLELADRLVAADILDTRFNWRFFTNPDASDTRPESAGLGVAILGSLYMMMLVVIFSLPIGVAAAIYLEEFAPQNKFTDLIEVNISNLAAVPSIVFGILGLAIFINWAGLPQSSPLVGALVLTLMALPTIIIATRASLRAVPPSIRTAALGVGASKVQTVFHHVLPLAMPGILTGAILSLASSLGETGPLLLIGMVAFVVNYPAGPLEGGIMDPATALPVQVYSWASRSDPAFIERASGAIIVLLAFLLVMNIVAIILRRRFERRW
jgi:phosphate transport system permease protein